MLLLDALGGRAAVQDVQHALFLDSHHNAPPAYTSIAKDGAPWSLTSLADMAKLARLGLAEDVDGFWALTSEGRALAASLDPSMAASVAHTIAHHCGPLRGDALAAKVAREHSGWAPRFADDADPAPSPLMTLGYEKRSLEAYLNLLVAHGATLLCDVRRNPISRRYGFSKKALAGACREVGVEYVHLRALGIASAERKGLDAPGRREALFAQYRTDTLPRCDAELAQIAGWVQSGERVALTCFEREPGMCHRHCVSDHLSDALGMPAGLHL